MTDQFGNKMELGLIGILTNQEVGTFPPADLWPLQA
jgi:regulator of sigma E protease